jgi:hypothetical protein
MSGYDGEVRSGSRALVLLLLLVAILAPAACGSSEPEPKQPAAEGATKRGPHGEAFGVLDRLAGAMANNRADRLVDVADPVHGLRFWGQPGACASPLFQVSSEESGPLTALAKERAGDVPPHYTDPNGYWREVAQTIRAGLRVAKVDAGYYELPPEEGLERARPWASLDTRNVALGKRELNCLEGDTRKQAAGAPRSEYRYRFRAERGYSSVTVFLVGHKEGLRIAHVILNWHYDA